MGSSFLLHLTMPLCQWIVVDISLDEWLDFASSACLCFSENGWLYRDDLDGWAGSGCDMVCFWLLD